MVMSYKERDRIATTVIENNGGHDGIHDAMDSGEFDVSTVARLIREALLIASTEEEA